MLDWDDLRYFLALERDKTLARAAARLSLNPTTVSRRLSSLEELIGARLFDRTPGGYVLTAAGHELLPRAQRIEAEVLSLERSVAGADKKPVGLVRISVTEMIGTRFIAPHLGRLKAKYPEVTVDLSCTSRNVVLARREADIALRLARPREQGVVAKQLSRVHMGLYAAPSYLNERGAPEDPERSLAGHDLLLFADVRAFAIENSFFEERQAGAQIVLRSDSVSAVYSAAVAGYGIALLPRAVADRDPALSRIVTRSAPQPRVIWQAIHEDLAQAARIRAVVDFLAECVGTELPDLDDDQAG